MKKDKKLLDRLLKLANNTSYSEPTDREHLRKYVLSKCMLKLCDKKLSDGKKYGEFSYMRKNDWDSKKTKMTFVYASKTLSPRDFGVPTDYWYRMDEYPGGKELEEKFDRRSVIKHAELRGRYYRDERDMCAIINYLYNNQYELLVKALGEKDKAVKTAKKRSKDGKVRGELKSAVTFTKPEQIKIAQELYRSARDEEIIKAEKALAKLFNCKFSFGWQSLTPDSKNYILRLADSSSYRVSAEKTDPTGKKLIDEIRKTNIDADALFEEWLHVKDPLFRRFAIAALGEDVIGLLDKDKKIRMGAEQRIKK